MDLKRKGSSEDNANGSKKSKSEGDVYEDYHSKRKAVCNSVQDFKFNKKRVRMISEFDELPDGCKAVMYWMFREQRVEGRLSYWFPLILFIRNVKQFSIFNKSCIQLLVIRFFNLIFCSFLSDQNSVRFSLLLQHIICY